MRQHKIPHVWTDDQLWAIEGALGAKRPLLVKGEPGIGKTQLAYKAAEKLKRPLVAFTVDSATEARDLLWTFDAVGRLAEAQVLSNIERDVENIREKTAVKNFVRPGPIWWAINWKSAAEIAMARSDVESLTHPKGWNTERGGVVVLIDEIDKATSDVPNGLLEAFGTRRFQPLGWESPIEAADEVESPLIIVTTNEERVLPDPFVRRCLVLELTMPECLEEDGTRVDKEKEKQFVEFLVERGKQHFNKTIPIKELRRVATMLLKDRQNAILNHVSPKPGQAEYIDMLTAMSSLVKQKQKEDPKATRNEIYQQITDKLEKYVFLKSSESSQ